MPAVAAAAAAAKPNVNDEVAGAKLVAVPDVLIAAADVVGVVAAAVDLAGKPNINLGTAAVPTASAVAPGFCCSQQMHLLRLTSFCVMQASQLQVLDFWALISCWKPASGFGGSAFPALAKPNLKLLLLLLVVLAAVLLLLGFGVRQAGHSLTVAGLRIMQLLHSHILDGRLKASPKPMGKLLLLLLLLLAKLLLLLLTLLLPAILETLTEQALLLVLRGVSHAMHLLCSSLFDNMHALHSQLLLGCLNRSPKPLKPSVAAGIAVAAVDVVVADVAVADVAAAVFAFGFGVSQATHFCNSSLLRNMHAPHSHSLADFLN